MELKTVSVEELLDHPENPNTHPADQLGALGESLAQFEQVKNVVVWRGYLLAGHGLRSAARAEGLATLEAVDVSEWEESKAISFMLADNRLAELAVLDEAQLAEAFRLVDAPLEVPGFDADFLKAIGVENGGGAGELGSGGDDEPPLDMAAELQEKWGTELGQVWQLGPHRVACVDSLDEDEIKLLVAGDTVDMVLADPPYGINIVAANVSVGGGEAYDIPFGGKKNVPRRRIPVGGGSRIKDQTGRYPIESWGKDTASKRLGSIGGAKPFGSSKVRGSDGAANLIEVGKYYPVEGDDTTETAEKSARLLLMMFPDACHIWWGGNYYTNVLPPSSCWIIWDKDNTGHFADCEMAWTNQPTAARIFEHRWNGMLKASEHGQRRVHPTQKPIALPYWCFEKYGKSDDVIFDPFLGSGISVIAAEQIGDGRRVIGCEIVPEYIAVILERFQDAFDITPELLT